MEVILTEKEIQEIETGRLVEDAEGHLPDGTLVPEKLLEAYRELYGSAYVSGFRLNLSDHNEGQECLPLRILVGGNLRGPGRSKISVLSDPDGEASEHLALLERLSNEMERRREALNKT